MAFFQKIGQLLQEDFGPPYDGHFFLKLALYIAFFTFCLRLFGSASCMSGPREPERRIIHLQKECPSERSKATPSIQTVALATPETRDAS